MHIFLLICSSVVYYGYVTDYRPISRHKSLKTLN